MKNSFIHLIDKPTRQLPLVGIPNDGDQWFQTIVITGSILIVIN